jgi:AI-2 transport protein TqsA
MAANPLASSIVSAVLPDPEEPQPLDLGVPVIVETLETEANRAEQERADLHVQSICLLILAFVATGVALYLLRPVLVPFVLALFFAACLKPLIALQRKHFRFPQPLAVAGALVLAAVIISSIGIPLGMAISKSWPTFERQFDVFIQQFPRKLPLERLGLHPMNFQIPSTVYVQMSSWVGEVTGFASAVILVIIFTLFILLGRRADRPTQIGVLSEIEDRVQRYITQMVMLSAISGIAVGIILAVCGVKFAVMFGFLAFLLNFIPTVGSIIATLLPLPVILLSPEMGPAAKILALAIPATIQIYLGNAVQPRWLGNALDLHPIVVLISLIFWGMIWGLPGAFLATPMTAVLRIVLEKIPATRPIAELLAGRIEAVF